MKKNDQAYIEGMNSGAAYEPPRRITEDDFEEGFFGPGLGMGMGMGMGPPGDSVYGAADSVYFPAGSSLLYRHEWKQHLYLAEFLRYLNLDTVRFNSLRAAIDDTYLNLTEVDYRDGAIGKNKVEDVIDETGTDLNGYDDGLFQDRTGAVHKQNEILALHEFEMARDADRIADIFAESSEFVPLFENLCYFDGHSHPKTYQLVQTLVLVGFTLAMYFKETFRRKRPSVVDPTLDPVIKVPTFWAFPSGHSTQVHLIKNMLSSDKINFEFSTEMKEEIELTAREVARNREFAGVHYFSDSLAGEKLAASIWTNFLAMLKDINNDSSEYAVSENIIEKINSEWS